MNERIPNSVNGQAWEEDPNSVNASMNYDIPTANTYHAQVYMDIILGPSPNISVDRKIYYFSQNTNNFHEFLSSTFQPDHPQIIPR